MTFDRSASQVAYQEYLQQLKEFQQRLKVLEKEIEEQAKETLRGVAVITATSLVAEVGSFQR